MGISRDTAAFWQQLPMVRAAGAVGNGSGVPAPMQKAQSPDAVPCCRWSVERGGVIAMFRTSFGMTGLDSSKWDSAVRVVAMSDTHGFHRRLRVPAGESRRKMAYSGHADMEAHSSSARTSSGA